MVSIHTDGQVVEYLYQASMTKKQEHVYIPCFWFYKFKHWKDHFDHMESLKLQKTYTVPEFTVLFGVFCGDNFCRQSLAIGEVPSYPF